MQYFAIGIKMRTEHKIIVPYQVHELHTYTRSHTRAYLRSCQTQVWTQSDYDKK